MTPYMKQRQSWLSTGKPPKEKKKQKPLPKAKKSIARYSKKRQRAQRQYRKAIIPKLEGQPCQIRSPDCTGWAQGYNHPDGKESMEKMLNVDNGQVCCNPCNTYCETHHQWAVDNGFRGKRNKQTTRYANTYKPD